MLRFTITSQFIGAVIVTLRADIQLRNLPYAKRGLHPGAGEAGMTHHTASRIIVSPISPMIPIIPFAPSDHDADAQNKPRYHKEGINLFLPFYPLVCQSAQEIGGNKSQFKTLVIYFLLRKDTSQNPLFS